MGSSIVGEGVSEETSVVPAFSEEESLANEISESRRVRVGVGQRRESKEQVGHDARKAAPPSLRGRGCSCLGSMHGLFQRVQACSGVATIQATRYPLRRHTRRNGVQLIKQSQQVMMVARLCRLRAKKWRGGKDGHWGSTRSVPAARLCGTAAVA